MSHLSGWARTELLQCPRLRDGALEPTQTLGVGPLHAVEPGESRAACGTWIAETSASDWDDAPDDDRCPRCDQVVVAGYALTPAEDIELRRFYAMVKAGEPLGDQAAYDRFTALRRRDRRRFIRPAVVPGARAANQ